jgi:tetratricopeptide (TPR) repeat protein
VADAAFSGILSWVESNKSLYSHNALGVLGSYILVGEDAANLNYNGHIKPQIFEQYLRFAYKVIEYNIQNNLSPQEKEINQSYWAMQNLLPLYEKYLPTELPKLRSHINELGNRVTQKTKDAILASRPNDSSSVDDLLRLADESTNPRKKDGLIVRAAMLAARQGDYEQAVFIMEKVDNLGIRNNMISTIYFQAGKKAVALKNTDLALQLARKIVHIHSQRWNLYFDVINVVANENKGRAIELLGEIEAYVKSMRDDAPERALGLFEIANVAGKIDVSRARTVARLAIRSLNSADFDKPQTEGIARITRDRFVFASLWTYFAHVDFDEAILLTGLIEYKPILVSSQILICKALLSENYKQQ